MHEALEQICEFYQIGDDIYTAGQPRVDQFKILAANKFEVVINLATVHSPDAIPNEQKIVMEHGMAYVHIPVEWEHPTREDLSKFFIFYQPHDLFKKFVHCAKNMRVSSFIFLYRVLICQSDPEKCLVDLLTIWEPNDVWRRFMDNMLVEMGDPEHPHLWKVDWVNHRLVDIID
jgi:protein tyrosine phosphatase (PTP) superfamily phosphohydrolase (DUF442 family)